MGRVMVYSRFYSCIRNAYHAKLVNLVATFGMLAFSTQSVAQIQFQDVTSSAGPFHTGESWGASWCDINGDRYPDLYVSNHGMQTSIYRNNSGNSFTDITPQADLDQKLYKPGDRNTNEADIHGASCADWDNDGDQDIFATRSSSGATVFLFENDGTGKFRERRTSYGIGGAIGGGRLPVLMDYDNDGKTDFALAKNDSARLLLFKQVANKRFTNTTSSTGMSLQCDRNAFGFPIRLFDDDKHLYFCMYQAKVPQKVFDTTVIPFRDVTSKVDSTGIYSDATMADFNNDLKTDMVVIRGKNRPNEIKRLNSGRIEAWVTANVPGEQRLIKFKSTGNITVKLHSRSVATKNQTTNKYEKIYIGSSGAHPSVTPGVRYPVITLNPNNTAHQGIPSNINPGGAYLGYNTATQEWNIYLTTDLVYFTFDGQGFNVPTLSGLTGSDGNMKPVFLMNNGNRLVNSGAKGVDSITCNSVIAEDFDNDMDVDLYIGCGGSVQNLANRFYWNNGNGNFSGGGGHGAAGSVGAGVAGKKGTTESVVAADYNVDGFIDILVTQGNRIFPHNRKDGFSGGGPDELFRNLANNGNKWLLIDLRGIASTRDGFGTKVIVTAGGVSQLREQDGRYHRWVHDHRRLHFGLKNNSTANVRIEWPDGTVDTYNNVAANKLYEAIQNGGLQNITPGTPPAGKQISINSVTVSEAAGTAQLTLSLSQPSSSAISVDYATANGSATAGSDYTARSATVTFQPGQTSKTVTITITDDSVAEPTENFTVNLSNPTGGATISQPTGTVTINDNDASSGGETISINSLAVWESAGSAVLTISLSDAAEAIVTVDYATANGSATAGSDYTARSATVTFQPGQTSKTATITINDDSVAEPVENFTVVLSNPTGEATLSQPIGTVTINDNDSSGGGDIACGDPNYNRATDRGLFIWKDCEGDGRWYVHGTGGGGSSVEYIGSVVTDKSFSNVTPISMESSDSLVSNSQSISFTINTGSVWHDAFSFNVATGTSCLTLDLPAGEVIRVGASKTQASSPFNIETLATCSGGTGHNITINDRTVTEGTDKVIMAVTLSSASTSTVRVNFSTSNGSATAGSDYVARSGRITFQPGQTDKTATITLLNDGTVEDTENFSVNLSNATGGATITKPVGTVTINDDD